MKENDNYIPSVRDIKLKELVLTKRSGRLLRSLRKSRRLSMEELGRTANITSQQVYKYEAGLNRLTLSRLETLLTSLGYSPQEFCHLLWLSDTTDFLIMEETKG